MLFDCYDGITGNKIVLRPDFIASVAQGTLRVFSLSPSKSVAIGAQVKNDQVRLHCRRKGVSVHVVVAGVHREFPNWDMPHFSDEQRIHSRRFWSKEWLKKIKKPKK
jgi:hypothetical protein